MDNVVKFTGETYHDIPVEDVLDEAKGFKYSQVMIVGELSDGQIVIQSSSGDIAKVNYMIDLAKNELFAD